jgi:DNA-binding NtrC family response regulator
VEADVRIVAATNANLLELVRAKKFRVDLYYRLHVFPLHLPPLRDRGEDILLLADHFVGLANVKHRRAVTGIDDGLRELLMAYHWPGNVRQLENAMDRLVIEVAEGELTLSRLPADLRISLEEPPIPEPAPQAEEDGSGLIRLLRRALSEEQQVSEPQPMTVVDPLRFVKQVELPSVGVEMKSLLQALENRLIDQALDRCGDNRNQAAQLLGLKRTTLVEKLRKREKEV